MFLRKLTGAALTVAIGLASVALSSPARAEEAKPDLKVTVAFNRDIGKVGDAVTVSVTITNNGTVTAKNVRNIKGAFPPLDYTPPTLADGPGVFDLAPGESTVRKYHGIINQEGYKIGHLYFAFVFQAENWDENPRDNWAFRNMRVPGIRSNYTVRAQEDHTHVPVAGVVVEITEQTDSPGKFTARLTTDAAGNADFTNLPLGRYIVRAIAPAGWTGKYSDDLERYTWVEPNDPDKLSTLTLVRNGDPTTAPSTPAPAASTGGPAPNVPPTGGPVPSVPSTGKPAPSVPSSEGPAVAPSSTPSGEALVDAGEGDDEEGGLPLTGGNATAMVGAGLGLFVAGGAAFLLARQRRTRFTSSG
ncbi:SdrD B-like domain-containing protein [Couchioplanes caeruleus]|uniref:SD-repeat containing protein B domain-containing protein n=2 Tax=Couchioplanes caeruleus TaxID=56438 RepID=A0A1K0FL47_9ACTN|nr:SpaA isopeptide-forming pilin-related protein [Couchioplanes caeruleus]OJF13567.1 hypothetical protein BG844_14415 [Couchioplanes caeruleus subsp. caeruleus]ROP30107.1 putative repeat protein (TIGR01451 family) [Couchioplanes caeruleus]